jgi:hypothetical protein
MSGADDSGEAALPANLEEMQAQVAAAWRALVEAAFGLTNAVNAAKPADEIRAAEHTLGDAARTYAATSTELVDALRPASPRRPRRR